MKEGLTGEKRSARRRSAVRQRFPVGGLQVRRRRRIRRRARRSCAAAVRACEEGGDEDDDESEGLRVEWCDPIYGALGITVGINRGRDLRGGFRPKWKPYSHDLAGSCASLRWPQKIRSPREPLCPRQSYT